MIAGGGLGRQRTDMQSTHTTVAINQSIAFDVLGTPGLYSVVHSYTCTLIGTAVCVDVTVELKTSTTLV